MVMNSVCPVFDCCFGISGISLKKITFVTEPRSVLLQLWNDVSTKAAKVHKHTCSISLHLLLRAKYFLLSSALRSSSSRAAVSGSSFPAGPSSTWTEQHLLLIVVQFENNFISIWVTWKSSGKAINKGKQVLGFVSGRLPIEW